MHTRRCSMHIIKLDIISYIGGTVLDDGRMGKRGRSRRFALLSARRGASLLSYSQLFRKLLMPMKTLADWRERRNDVHSALSGTTSTNVSRRREGRVRRFVDVLFG